MNIIFYIAALVALFSTAMVITRLNAVRALLYLIVSFLAISVVFFALGAPFVAALEVIIYAGAIMVLFLFVVMMLNLGPRSIAQESQWLSPRAWLGPGILAAILLVELIYGLLQSGNPLPAGAEFNPQAIGIALFGPYLLGVELAALLLLAGLVGAYHLGRRDQFN